MIRVEINNMLTQAYSDDTLVKFIYLDVKKKYNYSIIIKLHIDNVIISSNEKLKNLNTKNNTIIFNCELSTYSLKYRLIYYFHLNDKSSKDLIIFLCNPASSNIGLSNKKNDLTIQFLLDNLDLTNYKRIIIFNVLALVSKKLENLDYDFNDSNLLYELDQLHLHNISIIKETLKNKNENGNIDKILLAFGQHMIHSSLNKNLRNNYKNYLIDILDILTPYKDNLYYLEKNKTNINYYDKKLANLPLFPSNFNKSKFITNPLTNKLQLLNYYD